MVRYCGALFAGHYGKNGSGRELTRIETETMYVGSLGAPELLPVAAIL